MKKGIIFLTACTLSPLVLTGCGSDLPNLNTKQTMGVVTLCLEENSKHFFKNNNMQVKSISVSTFTPQNEHLSPYISVLKKNLSPTELDKFKTYLNTNPLLFKTSVTLTQDKENYTCEYIYSTNKEGVLQKRPLLYQIKKPDTPILPVFAYAKPLDLFPYYKSLISTDYGISFRDVQDNSQLSLSQADSNLAEIVLSSLSNMPSPINNTVDFQQLSEPTLPVDSYNLAQQAMVGVVMPESVNQNPIYLTPVVVSRRMQLIANYTPSNSVVRDMEKFNKNRYVDPDTGIQTRHDILENLRDQYGLNDDRNNIIQEIIDNKGNAIKQTVINDEYIDFSDTNSYDVD